MLARGASVFGEYGHEEEGGYGSHDEEDIASENRRLKQELARLRRLRSSSVVDGAPRLQEPRRSTLDTLVHGRAQEQLREVIEENEHLVERLKLKELEVEEWRGDYTKLQQTLEEQRKRFGDAEASGEKEHPKDIRLFKKKAQDVMKKLQEEKDRDLAKADQLKKLLKMQLDDSQARCARGKAEIVRLERELSHSEAANLKKQATLDDLQHHYEELRGMLEDERRSVEQLRGKVLRLEEELEAERMQQNKEGQCGETLEMLDRFMQHSRRSSLGSNDGELAHLTDGESRQEPEICGQLKDQLVELQREYEQLRAQLAIAVRSQELAAEHEEELQKRLSDAEELRLEREQLRSQQTLTEARLREADEECALLRTQLAASQKLAAEACERSAERQHQPEVVAHNAKEIQKPERSVDSGTGASSTEPALGHPEGGQSPQHDDLRRECDMLRTRLANVGEELTRAREAERAAAAAAAAAEASQAAAAAAAEASEKSPAKAEAGIELEDLQRECQRLREELATARQSREPRCQAAQASEAACGNCERLLRQLASAQDLQQELRREHEQLRRQLADSEELEQEHRRHAEHLRQQLAAAQAEAPPPPSAALQLAGSVAPSAAASTTNEARFLADERCELLRRNQELLDAMQQLQKHVEATSSNHSADAKCAEELRTLQRESCELRERLHTSRMAELEAQRKADVIPELMSKIVELQSQATAAEKSAAEWREVATDTSWSGIFGSFMCAAPERRRHPQS